MGDRIHCVYNWVKLILFAVITDILLVPIFLLKKIVPKDPHLWVVVSKDFGPPFDNTKYFFLLASKSSKIKQKNIQIYFISKDIDAVKELKKRGYNAEVFPSFKAILLLLRSWYIIHDYVSYRYAFLYKLAYDVELWHGVGIKKVGWQQRLSKCGNYIERYICPFIFRPDFFFTTSPYYKRHFMDAYRLRESKVFDVGNYPRNIALLRKVQDEDINMCQVEKRLSECNYNYILVYLPTFRINYTFIRREELIELGKFLDKINAVLVVKLHPNDKITNISGSIPKNILFLDKKCDIYPILRKADILITDFSSVGFDFMLTKKPILLFIPDEQQYLDLERDIIMNPEELGFPVSRRLSELLSDIQNYLSSKKRNSVSKSYYHTLSLSFSAREPAVSVRKIIDVLISRCCA